MKRAEVVRSIRGALTSLRFDGVGASRSKIASILEDRLPGSRVVFDNAPGAFDVSGSVFVENIDPVQFRFTVND